MRHVGEIHELSSGVWVVVSPVGLYPGDAGGVICKSPHELVCAILRVAGVEPAIYLTGLQLAELAAQAQAQGRYDDTAGNPLVKPREDYGNPITPLTDPEQDDDEGSRAEGPRCSTGGCGVD